nr:translation initiation factor IF-2-like [Rattus norvegicus]
MFRSTIRNFKKLIETGYFTTIFNLNVAPKAENFLLPGTRRTSAAHAEVEPKAQGGRQTSGVLYQARSDRTAQEQTLPGLPVILRRPRPALLTRPAPSLGSSLPLPRPRAAEPLTDALRYGAHWSPPPPRPGSPGPGPCADLASLVRAARALSPCGGSRDTSLLQPTSQAGRGGQTGGACGRAPIPHHGLLSDPAASSEPCGVRSPGSGPEAQEDLPKCREMCGGLARDVAPPAGRRRPPGTRRARAGGVGSTRVAVVGLRL